MQKPVVEPPQERSPAPTWQIWAGQRYMTSDGSQGGRLRGIDGNLHPGGHGECLRRIRGEAEGESWAPTPSIGTW